MPKARSASRTAAGDGKANFETKKAVKNHQIEQAMASAKSDWTSALESLREKRIMFFPATVGCKDKRRACNKSGIR